jgi:hypothetical protein
MVSYSYDYLIEELMYIIFDSGKPSEQPKFEKRLIKLFGLISISLFLNNDDNLPNIKNALKN